jgi:hypothetical protein
MTTDEAMPPIRVCNCGIILHACVSLSIRPAPMSHGTILMRSIERGMDVTQLDLQQGRAIPFPTGAGGLETAAASGDSGAFAELYERYRPRIHAYLLTYVSTHEEAGDLTQQVFLRAFQHLPSYRQSAAPFSSWLFRIARNAAIDASRRRRRHVP